MAQREEDEDWVSFHFTSFDNPLLDPKEIEAAKKSMSSFSFRQEYLASFEAAQSDLFKDEWIKYVDSDDLPDDGSYYIAVDLAGFEDVSKQASNKKKHLDETAIAVVKVCLDGWYVDTIVAGRWDIKETAVKYDYAACNDPEWNKLEAEIYALKDKQKERETFLKTIRPHGIDIFLFNNVRLSLLFLVVFQERFNKRALRNLTVAGIRLTVLPEIL